MFYDALDVSMLYIIGLKIVILNVTKPQFASSSQTVAIMLSNNVTFLTRCDFYTKGDFFEKCLF